MTNKQEIEWKVEGMTCANCAKSITRFLENKQVDQVEVNFATKEVRFEIIEGNNLEPLRSGISDLGFQVVDEQFQLNFWTIQRKFLFSLVFTLPLFLHMFLPASPLHHPLVQLILCTPVFLMGLYHFGLSAWKSIRMGLPNMDVLIFIGSSAAFIYSLSGTILALGPDYLFYETAAMIITLVLLGNLIEAKAIAKTTHAIDALQALEVSHALKRFKDGVWKLVPTAKVRVQDILQANLGDAIPTDGVITEGWALIDESMLTGESIPVKRSIGDTVIGSSVIKEGQIQMRVTHVGKQTVLSQIIQLVKTAQADKPDIQRLADRISAIFVPVVLILSGLTFILAWLVFQIPIQQALLNAIAVLVISCPCAMGLATPTAVMVGVGRAAKNGVLVRGGQTLELLANIKQFIFDKTGTLTSSKPKLESFELFNGLSRSEVEGIILELEKHSSHPLAASIRSAISKSEVTRSKIQFTSISEEQGAGLVGVDQTGLSYRIGKPEFALKPEKAKAIRDRIVLSKNFEPVAMFRLSEELRPESKSVVQALQDSKAEVILLSGDSNQKTEQIARELNIQKFFAEQSPANKLEKIKALSSEGPTAMIGDGINDAPALAQATIGISMNQASAVAIQSANVVLMSDSLEKLPFARQISQKTLVTIKENLFWAFSYNLVAIPLAAMGFLNPMWGAIFMAFSDVVVIGNSIRLNFRKLDN